MTFVKFVFLLDQIVACTVAPRISLLIAIFIVNTVLQTDRALVPHRKQENIESVVGE